MFSPPSSDTRPTQNEQEYLRIGTPTGYAPNWPNQTIDSIIDDATTHELYVWPFAEAIRAGSASVMCACACRVPIWTPQNHR